MTQDNFKGVSNRALMTEREKHDPNSQGYTEEVGALRKDVETLKEAMKLLDRHDERIEKIEQRLSALERQIH